MGRQTAEMMLKIARDRLFFDLSNGSLDESKQERARECFEEINNIISKFYYIPQNSSNKTSNYSIFLPENLTPKEEI